MKGLSTITVVSNIAFDDDLEHVPDAAFRTFIELIGVSAFDLSDGRVALGRAQKLCNTRYLASALDSLSRSGHVLLDGDEVVIPSYAKYQRTRAEVEEERENNRERVRRYRAITNSEVTQTVTFSNDLASTEERKKESPSSLSSPSPHPYISTVHTPPTPITPITLSERKKEERISPRTKFIDTPEFNEFWQAYPRRVGKGQARRAFKTALDKTTLDTILRELKRQVPALTSRGIEYVPYPSTWLNGERWDDEPDSNFLATPSEEDHQAFIAKLRAQHG